MLGVKIMPIRGRVCVVAEKEAIKREAEWIAEFF